MLNVHIWWRTDGRLSFTVMWAGKHLAGGIVDDTQEGWDTIRTVTQKEAEGIERAAADR